MKDIFVHSFLTVFAAARAMTPQCAVLVSKNNHLLCSHFTNKFLLKKELLNKLLISNIE
jgi:hypothetical protein